MNRKFVFGLAAALLLATPSIGCVASSDAATAEEANHEAEALGTTTITGKKSTISAGDAAKDLGISKWVLTSYKRTYSFGLEHEHGVTVNAVSASGATVAKLDVGVMDTYSIVYLASFANDKWEAAQWEPNGTTMKQTQFMTAGSHLAQIANAFVDDTNATEVHDRKLGVVDCASASAGLGGAFLVTGGSCVTVETGAGIALCAGSLLVLFGAAGAFASLCFGG